MARSSPIVLQKKLAIGRVDDPLEHEADAVAEKVMRMPAPAVSVASASPQLSRKCAACEGEEEKLQKKRAGPATASEVPPIVHDVLSEPGQPLDASTRSFFEPRFGADFSGVRVHTASKAARSARKLNALAFTVGNHLVFDEGQFAPETNVGRHLLAHELSHIIQQGAVGTPAASGHQPLHASGQRLIQRLSNHDKQLACVIRRGGCASGPQNIDGGIPDDSIVKGYNKDCREASHFETDIFPSPDECKNPPKESLSKAEAILLTGFLVVAAGAAIAATIAAAEVVVPIVIANVSAGATAAGAFYFANAIAVNEIGLFAAGLFFSCGGDVVGLLQAIKEDPAQGALILAEVYILHTQITVANGPPRRASVPVKLLPVAEQTDAKNIRFKTVGAPVFEESNEKGGGTTQELPPAASHSGVPKSNAPKPNVVTPSTAENLATGEPPVSKGATPKPAAAQPPKAAGAVAPFAKNARSVGEMEVEPRVFARRPRAKPFSNKSTGFDGSEDARTVFATTTTQKDGTILVEQGIAGGNWMQIKQVGKPDPELFKAGASGAMEGMAKGLRKFKNLTQRENLSERVSKDGRFRTVYAGPPDKVTIILELQEGEISSELRIAAQRGIDESPYKEDLPAVQLVIEKK
jgi:hypothetical protein